MLKQNLTMLTDFYELTMGNGYFLQGVGDRVCYFDVFFRKVPENGGYVVAAGLESFIDYIENLRFEESDIEYLKSRGFDGKFLDYLRNFKFACDVWAVPEGTPIFPGEPILTVRGPAVQAQFIETMTLLLLNHQSLIATKASRIVRAAAGRAVMEFGSRRAQGCSGAVEGARSAYIGGCVGTACTMCDPLYGIPALGTMAHSWVQLFGNEYEAFAKYAEIYPDNCVLLVDTYDTLRSGIPNAIKVFDKYKPKKKGIRIDSGDIAYLTKKARKMLDAAGHPDCSICVSNSLDEYLIKDILHQGARIDSFGVGERLITASAEPVLGCVYKLCAVEENGSLAPRIKISDNADKVTNPGFKKVWRLRNIETGKDFADVITLFDEEKPKGPLYPVVDMLSAKLYKQVGGFEARELLVPIYKGGKFIYKKPALPEIRERCAVLIEDLWTEVLRFENPHRYYVDLSRKLWDLRSEMLGNFEKESL